MAKKAFRAQKTQVSSYPRLADLRPASLCRWGLAALGGLVLAGAACTPKIQGRLPTARVPAVKLDSGVAQPLPPPGEPPAAWVETATSTGTAAGTEDATTNQKKVKKDRTPPKIGGVRRRSRTDD
jgi:hypothetical protein